MHVQKHMEWTLGACNREDRSGSRKILGCMQRTSKGKHLNGCLYVYTSLTSTSCIRATQNTSILGWWRYLSQVPAAAHSWSCLCSVCCSLVNHTSQCAIWFMRLHIYAYHLSCTRALVSHDHTHTGRLVKFSAQKLHATKMHFNSYYCHMFYACKHA